MNKPLKRIGLILFLLLGNTWCGDPDVGEECDQPYAFDACVEGAVCVPDRSGFAYCEFIGRLGERCTNEGAAAECEQGTICGKDASDDIECLEICKDQNDCPSGFDCNGVEGTDVKGCRNK